jgi:hypothetical protein
MDMGPAVVAVVVQQELLVPAQRECPDFALFGSMHDEIRNNRKKIK